MRVKVRGAKDLYNTEWFGKMDPYCKAKLSKDKTASSPEAHDAGSTPKWEWEKNCAFQFDLVITQVAIVLGWLGLQGYETTEAERVSA